MALVLRFNAFDGKLLDAYWMDWRTKTKIGEEMTACDALGYLQVHPETRCVPIKV